MKIDKLIFFLVIFLCFCKSSIAQRRISLNCFDEGSLKLYNLNGAELYLYFGDSIIFVPKVSVSEFEISKNIDNKLSIDTIRDVKFKMKTNLYIFSFNISGRDFYKNKDVCISFYRDRKQNNISVAFLGKGNYENYGYSIGPIKIIANKEWKEKYYTPKSNK